MQLEELAAEYGTPAVVMDAARIRKTIGEFVSACKPRGIGISYAAKALLCTKLAALIEESGIGIDVCSLGELAVAERGGMPPARITMHGAGKTDEELRACVAGRVRRIVVDGLSELPRLVELADASRPLDVLLRINTGVDVDTHRHVTTVGERSKFGVTVDEEPVAAAFLRDQPGLRFAGVHAHAGSQIPDMRSFQANAAELYAAIARLHALGLKSTTLVAGGGFAVDESRDADDSAGRSALLDAIVAARKPGDPNIDVEIEPGRAIVARAGTTVYTVLSVKRRPEETIVIVDGGIADNPRPALYGAQHRIGMVTSLGGSPRNVRVFGRACEDDFIGDAQLPDDIDRGDLVAVHATGAYTYSMSSNYNGFPKPALIGVDGDRSERWN